MAFVNFNIKKWTLILIIIVISGSSGCFNGSSIFPIKTDSGAGNGTDSLNGQLMIRLKPGMDITTVLKTISGRVISYNPKLDYYLVQLDDLKSGVAAARRILGRSDMVALAEPNHLVKASGVPNDQGFAKQWGLEKINASAGWELAAGSDTVIIAIIDTGIDQTHPDLAGEVISGYNALSFTVGFTGDDSGHGTHCAGIAAAIANNGAGIAGVASGCKLMPVKVLNADGEGSEASVADGIIWAADHGADVINLSLGGSGYSRILEDAVDYAVSKDITIIAAAGNGTKFNDDEFPANLPGVIAVGATGPDNTKARFSSESNHLFIAAPGENIYSTLPGNRYGYLSGTSMSAPFISGAVALIKSKFGKALTFNQICSQLKKTSTDIEASGWDPQTGWGLLNLQATLSMLQSNEFGALTVTVDDGNGNVQPNAQMLLLDADGKTIVNVATDKFGKVSFWSLNNGLYNLAAERLGYRHTATASVSSGNQASVNISLPVPAPVSFGSFFEDAESVSTMVTTEGTWGKTDISYESPAHSWTESPSGNYLENIDVSLITVPFSLVSSVNPCLKFWHKYSTEANYDWCDVDISTDGGLTWANLDSYSGSLATWQQVVLNLAAYNTEKSVMIRFRFTSDYSNNYDGWYVDDIAIVEQ